jgi:hypothetical protein
VVPHTSPQETPAIHVEFVPFAVAVAHCARADTTPPAMELNIAITSAHRNLGFPNVLSSISANLRIIFLLVLCLVPSVNPALIASRMFIRTDPF